MFVKELFFYVVAFLKTIRDGRRLHAQMLVNQDQIEFKSKGNSITKIGR